MSPTRLSVVMPHFNHGAFIGRAVAALQAQDHPPAEIIIVDDGSSDGSLSLIEALIADQPTIRLIKNGRNLGVNESIRRGVEVACGEFLFMASADDEVLPGLFRDAIDMLVQYPGAALCSGHCLVVDADFHSLGLMKIPRISDQPCYVPPASVSRLLVRHGNWIISGTTVYRTEFWRAAGGINPGLEGFGDEFLVTVLALRHGACFVPKPWLAWRRPRESVAIRLVTDVDRAQAVAEAAVQIMRGPFATTFPRGYAERWRRRWMFGVRNFMLKRALTDQSQRTIWVRSTAWLRYYATALCLFVQMRPFDIGPMIVRTLKWWFGPIPN